jgi:hypothetical protein
VAQIVVRGPEFKLQSHQKIFLFFKVLRKCSLAKCTVGSVRKGGWGGWTYGGMEVQGGE